MGQKVHPTSFRIGTIYEWRSQWYSDQGYADLLAEDRKIRDFIRGGLSAADVKTLEQRSNARLREKERRNDVKPGDNIRVRDLIKQLSDASVARIDIERNANQVSVQLHTAKPGIVIGRNGQNVDKLRQDLEALIAKPIRLRVEVSEIRVPELDAQLVARHVAEQLERRIAFRRAIKQAVQRTMQRGAEGAKIIISGRLGGAEMSRRAQEMSGRVPLHTLRADIDYGFAEAKTVFGRIGVKVWIYRGEVLPSAGDDDTSGGPAQAIAPPPRGGGRGQGDRPEGGGRRGRRGRGGGGRNAEGGR